MNMIHEPNPHIRRMLAVGFSPSKSNLLAGVDSDISFYPDPEFGLLHRDTIGFDAAIIDQKQLASLQYSQARYLVELTRKMPLLAYVNDAMFFDSRNCPCVPDGLVFKSRPDIFDEASLLGGAGYWLLPGELEWQDLLLGKSREDLCAGFGDIEWAFLNYLESGWSNNRIAEEIRMSLSEVKGKLIEMYRCLGVENRTQAAIVAFYLSMERD